MSSPFLPKVYLIVCPPTIHRLNPPPAQSLPLLQRPVHLVQRVECPPRCADALEQQDAWDHDPERVHQDEVAPVIGRLGPGVGPVEEIVVKHACRVVQDVAVQLAKGDDGLQRVAERVVGRDETGGNKR